MGSSAWGNSKRGHVVTARHLRAPPRISPLHTHTQPHAHTLTRAPSSPARPAEAMYRNLRRALPEGAPESVHFCDIPEAEAAQVGGHTRARRTPTCTPFAASAETCHTYPAPSAAAVHAACLASASCRRATRRSRPAWSACNG